MTTSYFVPAAEITVEQVIKRSRFITVIAPIASGSEGRALQQRMRLAHPDASHHCLAFNAGPPNDTRDIGCSDDGEPSGSAGRPMLNVVLGSDIGRLAAVVVRYYGGTQLGVGGLVRAYAGGVKLGLSELNVAPFIARSQAILQCEYADMALVEHLLNSHQATLLSSTFQQQCQLLLELPQTQWRPFAEALSARSRGRLQLQALR